MGEIPQRQSNTRYYHLFDGQMCRTVKPGTEGAKQRTNKNGEEVFELFVGGLDGLLVDIQLRDFEIEGAKEYSWNFTLDDGEMRCVLGIPENSRIANQLLKRLPNADLSKPISIVTGSGYDTDAAKTFQWCNVIQGGNKVPSKFTRENPNGMPELVLVKFKGKEQWDNTDQLAFFRKLVEEELLPKAKQNVSTLPESVQMPDEDAIEDKSSSGGMYTRDIDTNSGFPGAPPVNDAPPPDMDNDGLPF